MERGAVDEQRDIIAKRAEFIEILDEVGPLQPRDIVEELDHSRSTVTRALRELRDVGVVEKHGGEYAATNGGVMAVEEYRRHEAASRAILTSKGLLDALHDPESLPAAALPGAETYLAEESAPFQPLAVVSDRLRDADTIRAYLPTLVNPHLLQVWHRNVTAESADSVGVFDDDLLTLLQGQYPELLAEMGASTGFSAFTGEGPPFGLFLTTAAGGTTVSVIVYDGDSGVRGTLVNDSERAVEWGQEQFAQIVDGADAATETFDSLTGAVEDGVPELGSTEKMSSTRSNVERDGGFTGHALPLDLETEGFVRLSKEYFDSRETAPPEVCWQTGFTLAEIRAGYAADRFDGEDRNFADWLVGELQDGDDHVLLGPPGAGKSTVSMSVACEWYERQFGPVLYRERGKGEEFSSPALLEAYLRQVNDHALVVVEDAIREESNDIFEVVQSLEGRADVTFLLDSRRSEWNDPDEFAFGPRLDAHRRTSIEEVVVPELDDKGFERFVAQFQRHVDHVDISGHELRSNIEDGTETANPTEPDPGSVLLAQTQLSRRLGSVSEGDETLPNALEADVRQTYRALADAEEKLVVDLGVLANLLSAAGIPVAEEHMYALADGEDFADLEDALSVLDGKVLFSEETTDSRGMTYRTHHEEWSRTFLEQLPALLGDARARETFGRCVTRLLSLADDTSRRDRIDRHFHRAAPRIHRIEADPSGWADQIVERVFALGKSHCQLTPLYGETDDGTIEIPDACSAFVREKQPYWRGHMNGFQGNPERAKSEVERLIDVDSSTSGLSEREATQLQFLGHRNVVRYHSLFRDFNSASKHAHRALDLANKTNRVQTRVEAYVSLLGLALARNDPIEAREYLEKLRTQVRECDQFDKKGLLLSYEARCLQLEGALEKARKNLQKAIDHAEGTNSKHKRVEAMALSGLGMIACRRNNFESAKSLLHNVVEFSRSRGHSLSKSRIHVLLARVDRKQGNLTEAERRLQSASNYAEDVPWLYYRHHSEWCHLEHNRGNLSEAREWGQDGVEAAKSGSSTSHKESILRTLSQIAIRKGEFEQADNHLEQSRRAAKSLNNPLKNAACDRVRARLELAQDNYDEAASYAQQGLEPLREAGITDETADCYRLIGLAALERGDTESAAEHLHEGLDIAEESGVVRTIGECHEAVARLERDRSDTERARHHRDQAIKIFERLGDRDRAEQIETQFSDQA